jgi:DNA-binding response OmpR family regulator
MTDATADLSGFRVLVVEDRFILAEEIGDMLDSLGCEIAGPARGVSAAQELLRLPGRRIDAAVLDIHLAGELVFPLAAWLSLLMVPFVLASGYDRTALPPEWRDVPHIRKPYGAADLTAALKASLSGRDGLTGRAGAAFASWPADLRPPVRTDEEAGRAHGNLLMEQAILARWQQIASGMSGRS